MLAILTLTPALAVGAPGSEQRAEARERFDRGLKLFDQGDDDGALVEFERAYELVPHPLVLYNIGLVQIELGRPVEAVRTLDRVLAQPGSLSAAQIAHARDMRAKAAARIGKLDVRVDVPGARLELDGVDVGKTPLERPLEVASGTRTLTVVARGHHPSHHRVSIAGGATEVVNVQLEPLEGRIASLAVESRLLGAEVVVDGRVLGKTPLAAPLSLAPGRYTLELRRSGYRSSKRDVVLGDGASASVELNPEIDAAAVAKSGGMIEIVVSDPSAVAFIDDRPVRGFSLRLPSGPHRLRVERAGFFPFEREVNVAARGTSRVVVELEPSPQFRADYRESAERQRFWSWVAIGGGAVVAAGGAGFLIWNHSERNQAQDAFDSERPRHEQGEPCWPGNDPDIRPDDCRDLDALVDQIDQANARYPIGWAIVAVGAAAIGAGTFFLLTSDDPDRYEPGPESDIFGRLRIAPTPIIEPGRAGFGVIGSF